MKREFWGGACLSLVLAAGPALAGVVEIVEAVAYADPGGKWRFDVTLKHGDTGWEHYADQWDVLAPDGSVLGTRVLYHPHVNEQPFTRSLGGVAVPEGLDEVTIRAHDKVHGWADKTYRVELPR
ncbi:hypothetical protein [Limibacillus halophilus]